MTTPINHHVTITNRAGNVITADVMRVKDLGGGKAEVDVETKYYIEIGYAFPAIYATPGHEATGKYKIIGKEFTERLTYIYKGEFTRAQ